MEDKENISLYSNYNNIEMLKSKQRNSMTSNASKNKFIGTLKKNTMGKRRDVKRTPLKAIENEDIQAEEGQKSLFKRGSDFDTNSTQS